MNIDLNNRFRGFNCKEFILNYPELSKNQESNFLRLVKSARPLSSMTFEEGCIYKDGWNVHLHRRQMYSRAPPKVYTLKLQDDGFVENTTTCDNDYIPSCNNSNISVITVRKKVATGSGHFLF